MSCEIYTDHFKYTIKRNGLETMQIGLVKNAKSKQSKTNEKQLQKNTICL